MNRVSVIIPTYNRCGLVNETVRNVFAQSLRPEQVIVVDDGSTDGTVKSLRNEFGDQLCLIEQSNQGPGAARNAGLDVATGEFVWLMDSDDLASINKLECQVKCLRETEADVVYSPWARVYFDGATIRSNGPVLQQRPLPKCRDALKWFVTDWSLVFQHCLFRRSALKRAGDYRTDIWTCDDSEYFVRILSSGADVAFESDSLTLYRLDDHGKVTGGGFADSRRIIDWAICLIAMHDLCSDRADILDHPSFQLRLFKSWQELNRYCPQEQGLNSQIGSLLDRPRVGLTYRALIRRLVTAAKMRLGYGAWASCFQTGPMTDRQLELVHELGLTVGQ